MVIEAPLLRLDRILNAIELSLSSITNQLSYELDQNLAHNITARLNQAKNEIFQSRTIINTIREQSYRELYGEEYKVTPLYPQDKHEMLESIHRLQGLLTEIESQLTSS